MTPGRPRRHDDELVAAGPGDRVHEPDRLREDGRDLAQDLVAGPRPGLLVERGEAVDVEHGDRDLAALPLRAGDLELEHAAERAGVGQARQRVGVGDALEPLGALGRHRRGAERRDRRRREVRDRDEQRLLGRADLVRRPPSRTTARPRTPRRRRRRRPAAGPRTSSSAPSPACPRPPQRPGPVERRPVDRVRGILGHHGLEPGAPARRSCRGSAAARAATGRDRGGTARRSARTVAAAPASTITASAASRSCRARERRGAGREDGQRPGGGRGGFGHESLRVQSARRAAVGSAGTRRARSWRVGIVHPPAAPASPVAPRRGRLSSPR